MQHKASRLISKKHWLAFISITVLLVIMSFSEKKNKSSTNAKVHTVNLLFEHQINGQELKFDTVNYQNKLGQKYTMTMFKYYVSNIKVWNYENGLIYADTGYYLVNVADSASCIISLKGVPVDDYDSLFFTLGVDSLHNCSGAQSGALDPVNGMFWTWNSGYIFMKMEGKSPASTQPGHTLEYHIGGYKEPTNYIRNIRCAIGESKSFPTRSPAPTDTINEKVDWDYYALGIGVNVSGFFSSRHVIDFSKLPSVTDFHNSGTIADNYERIFHVDYKQIGRYASE